MLNQQLLINMVADNDDMLLLLEFIDISSPAEHSVIAVVFVVLLTIYNCEQCINREMS